MKLTDAFNGDHHLFDTFKHLIQDNGIDVVIETGTYHGVSTNAFATMGVIVHTVESNQTYYNLAHSELKFLPNVFQHFSNSPDFLRQILPMDKKVLLFLDAHWEASCPLLDELAAIAESGMKPIIAIHDFQVPNTDFGFDSYNGQDYTWDWIAPSIEKIYGKDFKHYYNTVAEGAKRGCVFIEPINQ